MQMEPFYLVLRYMSVAAQIASDEQSEPPSHEALVMNAIRHLDKDQRGEVVRFINRALSSNRDHKELARLFDDGNSYRIWHSKEGPRQVLIAIRAAAADATSGRPVTPT